MIRQGNDPSRLIPLGLGVGLCIASTEVLRYTVLWPVGTGSPAGHYAELIVLFTLGYALLWLGTGLFARVPLTAWYSSHDFGGRRAWGNPLFLRTNRILTLVWGVYFLFSAALPLWALGAGAAPLAIALAGQLAPLPLTAFTFWFQRWYPASAARGRGR